MKRAFIGADADERYAKAGHFLLAAVWGKQASRDWLDKKGLTLRKAAGEGIGSAGGFLVPTELTNAILDLRDTVGVLRRRALVWPMGRDSSVFPRRAAAGVTAAFIGEGATAGAGTFADDSVTLTAKKLGALATVSSELDEDSAIDLTDYVVNAMAWALAFKEDDCAINGDGTAAYGGINGFANLVLDGSHGKAKVVAASGHNTFALLDSTDLGNLMAGVKAAAFPRAAWFVSNVGLGATFARLAGGSSALQMGEFDGIPTPTYLGFPVIVTAKLPTSTSSLTGKAMMAFGDLYGSTVVGQRRSLTVARSEHRYFDADQIGILCTERFDAVNHDLGDNTNAGSLAVLVAP